MYRLTKTTIKDVWFFFLTKKGNIVHVGKNETVNNHRNIYLNNIIINVDSILFEDNQIINYNTVKTEKVFDINTEQIINFNSNYTIETLNEVRCGLLSDVNENWEITTGYGSIDKHGFDFTFQSSYIVSKIITKSAFYLCFNDYLNRKISCFLPEILDFSWHFTLQSLKESHPEKMEKYGAYEMTINNFVGIANGVLWMDIDVVMNGSFLLGLDTQTGKVIAFVNECQEQNQFKDRGYSPCLPPRSYTTIDTKRNILYGFASDWLYWQVDLSDNSPKIKLWDLSDEMEKHKSFVSAYMNCGISDSHIFFPVGSLGSTPQVFALNRETLKIDWQYHFTEGGQYFTPTKVEVTDTHLYVLDNTGTLHIFEKTEDN